MPTPDRNKIFLYMINDLKLMKYVQILQITLITISYKNIYVFNLPHTIKKCYYMLMLISHDNSDHNF